MKNKLLLHIDQETKGGPGSGNWGHAGRPGKRGGSSTGSGSNVALNPKAYGRRLGAVGSKTEKGKRLIQGARKEMRRREYSNAFPDVPPNEINAVIASAGLGDEEAQKLLSQMDDIVKEKRSLRSRMGVSQMITGKKYVERAVNKAIQKGKALTGGHINNIRELMNLKVLSKKQLRQIHRAGIKGIKPIDNIRDFYDPSGKLPVRYGDYKKTDEGLVYTDKQGVQTVVKNTKPLGVGGGSYTRSRRQGNKTTEPTTVKLSPNEIHSSNMTNNQYREMYEAATAKGEFSDSFQQFMSYTNGAIFKLDSFDIEL